MNHQIKNILYFIVAFVFWFSAMQLNATHIVGGQFSYKCLGNNHYAITLTVRNDCLTGSDTVFFDKPAEIAIYNAQDKTLAWRVEDKGIALMEYSRKDTLVEKPEGLCLQGNQTCVQEAVYTRIITLPFNEQGYIIV